MAEREPSDNAVEVPARFSEVWWYFRGPALVAAAFSIGFFLLVGWDLLRDNSVDGTKNEGSVLSLLSIALLLLVVWAGFRQVHQARRGRWAQGTGFGLLAILIVVFSAGESFTAAEAQHCNCGVSDRRGAAQAIWLAFDTIPILKINDALGWEEPQPMSVVTSSPGPLETPLRRWAPTIAVRSTVGVILVALAKVIYDRFGTRSQRRTPAEDNED